MLAFFVSLISIFLTLFFVVGVHEFGHFLIARWVGIKVLRFSIGFGKPLWRCHDKKGTEYVLSAIPLGGYVKMLDEAEGNVPPDQLHLAYNQQPIHKKMAVVIAGPLTNFIFSFVIYWFLFVIGFITIIPLIGQVTPNSIAEQAGLKSNQEIVSINDHPTSSWMAVAIQLIFQVGEKKQLPIQTKNPGTHIIEQHSLDLTHWQIDDLKPNPLESLGIVPYEPPGSTPWPRELLRKNQLNPWMALQKAGQETIDFTYLNLIMLKKIVLGKVSLQSLGGPITIFESASTALNNGIIPFLSFLAFFSIAIGVINVIPIPGLDGGHLLIQIIEFIIRRPLSEKAIVFLYRLGFAFLLFLFMQAMINDMMRLL